MKIATLTLNPVLDKSTSVDRLVSEAKLRCPQPVAAPGGGGVNVSRGLEKLGKKSTAILPLGGANGQVFRRLLNEKKVDFEVIEVQAETRESLLVSDLSTEKQYRFNMAGEGLLPSEAEAILAKIEKLKPELLVASGSLPAGLAVDFYEKVAFLSKKLGAKLILDTSGEPLRCAADEGLFLLKPNLQELAGLVGAEKLELDDVDEAALEIIEKGQCEAVVVSLGPQGAMLVTRAGFEIVAAPPVRALSTVGAGDSMVAGMAWAFSEGKNWGEMLRWGVACGSAATMRAGAQLFEKREAERLFSWLKKR